MILSPNRKTKEALKTVFAAPPPLHKKEFLQKNGTDTGKAFPFFFSSGTASLYPQTCLDPRRTDLRLPFFRQLYSLCRQDLGLIRLHAASGAANGGGDWPLGNL